MMNRLHDPETRLISETKRERRSSGHLANVASHCVCVCVCIHLHRYVHVCVRTEGPEQRQLALTAAVAGWKLMTH